MIFNKYQDNRYVIGWLYALSGYVPNLHYRALQWIEAMTF